MNPKTIATAKLQLSQIPSADAGVDDLSEFADTFDACQHWGSLERCAEIANAQDHASIDKLRSCLFFEARRWRHFGEEPDGESLQYWRTLVADIRKRIAPIEALTPARLADAIRHLPSDNPVPQGTDGYNNYTTQKDHWLGWLNPAAGTGTYPRRTGENATARAVYNRIGEPRMLLWLIEASGVAPELVTAARASATSGTNRASKCKAVRNTVPWHVVAEALLSRTRSNGA